MGSYAFVRTLFGTFGARPASRYLLRHAVTRRSVYHSSQLMKRKQTGSTQQDSLASLSHIWQESSSSRPLSRAAKLKSPIRPFRSSIVPFRPSL